MGNMGKGGDGNGQVVVGGVWGLFGWEGGALVCYNISGLSFTSHLGHPCGLFT
jgi:hypothetical protein